MRVVAWYGSVGSRVVDTVENVAPGDVVTIDGFAGSPNDVYWEIYAGAAKIGESVFHLSCSDDDMNGPEDCGSPQGDGKDKSGYAERLAVGGHGRRERTGAGLQPAAAARLGHLRGRAPGGAQL